jgi:hypothetical protein
VKSWPEDVQKDCRFVLGNLLEQGVERLQALVEAWRYGKGLMGAPCPDMIPKSGSPSSAPEQENKGDGMRTERITLEVTHDLDEPLTDWLVESMRCAMTHGESVRVVEEPAQAASGGGEQPRGWLTDKERHWIDYCRLNCALPYAALACLDAILARSSPPKVVLPKLHTRCEVNEANHKSPCLWFRRPDVIDALAAAGVAVKEVGRE